MATVAKRASKASKASKKIPANERCGREPQHMHMAGRGCCPHPECVKGSSPKPPAAPKKPKEMTNEELVESQRQIENEIRGRKAAETKRANSQLGKLADALKKNSDLLDILAPTHAEETDTSFCSDVQAINGLSAKRLVPACARCVLLDLIRGKVPLNEVQFVARLHLARVHLARLS